MSTPDTAGYPVAATNPAPDRHQADYFRRLLSERCAELGMRIGDSYRLLTKCQNIGELGEVRRLRRVLRSDEAEQRTVMRLIERLDERFSTAPRVVADHQPPPTPQTIDSHRRRSPASSMKGPRRRAAEPPMTAALSHNG